jgi:hypothetical protein
MPASQLVSDNPFPSVLLDEQASAPTTPPTGFWRVYAKSDGLYVVDDAGAEMGPFGTGGPGGGGDASWTNVTFENSWVDFDASHVVRYRKLSSGLVVITGAAKSGTANSTIFTLPVGYRPGQEVLHPVRCTFTQNTLRDCQITAAGAVTVLSNGGNAYIDLNVSFYAG